MTSTQQLTVWAMPVACSEALPRGQASACKAPTDPGVLGSGPCPRAPASVCPVVAPQAPLLSHLYLRPHWPDAEAPGSSQAGGGISPPKKWGCMLGPVAHPPSQGKEGPRL